jgi:hypothetical protein
MIIIIIIIIIDERSYCDSAHEPTVIMIEYCIDKHISYVLAKNRIKIAVQSSLDRDRATSGPVDIILEIIVHDYQTLTVMSKLL